MELEKRNKPNWQKIKRISEEFLFNNSKNKTENSEKHYLDH